MDETRRAQLDQFRVKSVFDGQEGLLKKYRTLMVGDQGWWSLIRFELIITLFGWIPGALGLALRALFFPFLFKKAGKKVIFGRDMNILSPHRIEIGDRVIFDDDVLLDGKGSTSDGIRIGNDVCVGQSSIIQTKIEAVMLFSGLLLTTSYVQVRRRAFQCSQPLSAQVMRSVRC